MPGNVDNKLIYHLGVLIPFWVLEILCEIVVIAAGAIGLSAWIYDANNNIFCTYDDYGDYACYYIIGSADLNLGYGAFGGALGLGVVFLILHIVQIALFGRRKLTPAANFGIELSRLIIWLAIFILEIVTFVYGDTSILAMAFVVVTWALYLGSTIYSIVIFHRARRGSYNGSLPHYTAPVAYSTNEQAQNYGPGPYQAPAAQQHYGPGPYQHSSEVQHQNQYEQPDQYRQPSQYSSTYPTSYVSPVSSPQPVYGHSAYPPPKQQVGVSSEKEAAIHGYSS